jgi:hypothetical protein
LTTFVSEDELWTIISWKLMHFCWSIAPRAWRIKLRHVPIMPHHHPARPYQTIEGNQGACSQLSRAAIQAYDCAWCHDCSVQYQTTREWKSTGLDKMIPCSKRCIGISIWRPNYPY